MTTFVDTSVLLAGTPQARDQDPVIVVVRSAQGMLREGLGESASGLFEKNFNEAYDKEEWETVIDLLLGNADVVFKKVSSADDIEKVSKTAEGYFEVTLSLLSKLDSVEAVVSKMDAFVATVLSAPSSVSLLKLKLLTTLFASLNPKAQLRLRVIQGLCRLAASDASHKLSPLVFSLVKPTAEWIESNEWDLTDGEKFDIFGLVASVASSSEKLRYLTLQASVASGDKKVGLMEKIAIESIRDSLIFSFPRPDSLSVATSKCIAILSSGSFADMERFVAEQSSFLASHNIDQSSLIEKMRVVALARQGTSTLTLAHVADSLKTTDPVTVVVRAIAAGLVVGSIDEVAGKVHIVATKQYASVETDLKKILTALS
jgi:hypothetical protein